MTTKELDTMVKAMRNYKKVERRLDVLDDIYVLYRGFHSINRNDIAKKLLDLYEEIDNIDTSELIKMGTFK